MWGFELPAVAERVLYRAALIGTKTPFEVTAVIEAFRHETPLRKRQPIPH